MSTVTLSKLYKKWVTYLFFFNSEYQSPYTVKLLHREVKNMIKIIIPDEVNDEWFAERNLDRMKCNMFALELEFEKNDSVAIGKIEKEFNVSHEDAVNIFLNAMRDQIASQELLDKVMS